MARPRKSRSASGRYESALRVFSWFSLETGSNYVKIVKIAVYQTNLTTFKIQFFLEANESTELKFLKPPDGLMVFNSTLCNTESASRLTIWGYLAKQRQIWSFELFFWSELLAQSGQSSHCAMITVGRVCSTGLCSMKTLLITKNLHWRYAVRLGVGVNFEFRTMCQCSRQRKTEHKLEESSTKTVMLIVLLVISNLAKKCTRASQ